MDRHCLLSLFPLLRFVYDHMYTRPTLTLSLNAASPQARKTEAALNVQSVDEKREKKHTHGECLLPSQSFLKRWHGFGIRWIASNVPPHFLSHTESRCAVAQSSPEQNHYSSQICQPAAAQEARSDWPATHTVISTHTHIHRESQLCFFPSHISYPFARLLSLALHLWLYLAHFIF